VDREVEADEYPSAAPAPGARRADEGGAEEKHGKQCVAECPGHGVQPIFRAQAGVCAAAERMPHKVRGATAGIKRDPFPFKRPPRHDRFVRLLGGGLATFDSLGTLWWAEPVDHRHRPCKDRKRECNL
jgi:hypothetical protein